MRHYIQPIPVSFTELQIGDRLTFTGDEINNRFRIDLNAHNHARASQHTFHSIVGDEFMVCRITSKRGLNQRTKKIEPLFSVILELVNHVKAEDEISFKGRAIDKEISKVVYGNRESFLSKTPKPRFEIASDYLGTTGIVSYFSRSLDLEEMFKEIFEGED